MALWATFVPCFLWIFLAGPYLEQISARPRLSAALEAIMAAVVGVILNLSIWFALHVLFDELGRVSTGPLVLPVPRWESLDPAVLGLAVLAGLLMLGLRLGMVPTLAILAGVGVILGLA